MPTIQEIRAKYPQYNDMSDQQLADSLHSKYYSDIPKDQFYQKIQLQPAKPKAETFGQKVWQDLQKREENIQNIKRSEMSAPSKFYQQIGQGAGAGLDVLGEVTSAITPQFVKDIGSSALSMAGQLPSMGGGTIGEAIPQELEQLSNVYQDIKTQYPETVGNIEATANIAALFSPMKGKSIKPSLKNMENVTKDIIDKNATRTQFAEFKKANKDKASALVFDRLQKDFSDPVALNKVLAQGVQGQGLIERTGKASERLAEGASQMPGAADVAEKYFEKRLSGGSSRVKQSIKNYISPSTDFYGTAEAVLEKGRASVKPLYKKAFEQNKAVASKRLDRILSDPLMKRAIADTAQNFTRQSQLVAVPDKELTELARELSSIGMMQPSKGGVSKGLKLSALDEIKKQLDISVRGAKRAMDMGSGTPQDYFALETLRKNFVDELDALDVTAKAGPNSFKPEGGLYKQARKKSGDYITNSQALEDGSDFMRLDAEELARKYKDMGQTDREMFKAGVGKSIRDIIDNTYDEGNFVKRIIGKEENRNKLKAVLSPKDYADLIDNLKAEDKLFKLRNEILKGSQTARRQAEMQDLAQDPSQIVQTVATSGIRGVAMDQFITFVKNKFMGINDKVAKDIANIFYETDIKKQADILEKLRNQAKLGNKPAQAGLDAYASWMKSLGTVSLEMAKQARLPQAAAIEAI